MLRPRDPRSLVLALATAALVLTGVPDSLAQSPGAPASQPSVRPDDTRRFMAEADRIAKEARMAAGSLPPLKRGGYEESADLIRFNGPAIWSLAQDTPKLRQFFMARVGRALPVSAFAETPLHDRMGFDHRNALDVALHHDGPEGRALMAYLRASGIPFIASWGAIPGSASGAPIHVGQPSARLTARR